MIRKTILLLTFGLLYPLLSKLFLDPVHADFGYDLRTYECNDWSKEERKQFIIDSYGPGGTATQAVRNMAEELMGTGKHKTTIDGTTYYVNLDHMVNYCVFIYGSPLGGYKTNPSTGEVHRTYLGYTYDGHKVPNPLYPEESASSDFLSRFYTYSSPWNKPWGYSSVYPEPNSNPYSSSQREAILDGAVDKYNGSKNNYYGNFLESGRNFGPYITESGGNYDASELAKYADIHFPPTDYTNGAFTLYLYTSGGDHLYSTFFIRPNKNPYERPILVEYECGTPNAPQNPVYEKAPGFPTKTTAKWELIIERTGVVVDSGTYDCPVTVSVTSNQKLTSGYIDYLATAVHPNDPSLNSSSTARSLWVSKVDIGVGTKGSGSDVDGEYRYEVEEPKDVWCHKWYGPSQTNQQNCTKDYNTTDSSVPQITTYGYDEKSEYFEQCYKYVDPHTSVDDSTCTRSYKGFLTIDGASSAYTGIPERYECTLDFYPISHHSISTRDVSFHSDTWSSSLKSGGTSSVAPGTNASNWGNFIGSNRYVYEDFRGFRYTNNNAKNDLKYPDFYSSDPKDGIYTIRCYNKPVEFNNNYTFDLTLNASHRNGIATTTDIDNIGLSETKVSTRGHFYSNDDAGEYVFQDWFEPNLTNADAKKYYEFDSLSSSDQKIDTYGQVDFITAHWYDFRALMQYNDGSDGSGSFDAWRDITNASEVFWVTTPWYDNDEEYSVNTSMAKSESCATGCSSFNGSTGFDHRITKDDWNKTKVKMFDNIVHINNKTSKENLYWAHSLEAVKIRGYNGSSTDYTELPIDGMNTTDPINELNEDPFYDHYTDNIRTLTAGDTSKYSAWVIWSDDPVSKRNTDSEDTLNGRYSSRANPFGRGQKELWTEYFHWKADDCLNVASNGLCENAGQSVEFEYGSTTNRANEDYRTIKVSYFIDEATSGDGSDKNSNDLFGLDHYDYLYDELKVKIIDDCSGDYYLIYGCPINQTWQNSSSGDYVLKSPMDNYLPPAYVYGFSTWDEPNNPFTYTIDFHVTGISGGAQNDSR